MFSIEQLMEKIWMKAFVNLSLKFHFINLLYKP